VGNIELANLIYLINFFLKNLKEILPGFQLAQQFSLAQKDFGFGGKYFTVLMTSKGRHQSS
jgi:hypothetical protein